jgi:hypothetical protein
VRHAAVSGSPPWEPAPQPTSELPWGLPTAPPDGRTPPGQTPPGQTSAEQTPADGRQAGHHPAGTSSSTLPPEAIWQAAPPATAAPPGSLFAPIARPESEQARSAPQRGDAGNAGTSSTGTGGRPIYVWNPTASSDSFQAPDKDHH